MNDAAPRSVRSSSPPPEEVDGEPENPPYKLE